MNDPIFCQFIPRKSKMEPDHPRLTLDSLHETEDSPVKGLVHRYPDKALFLRKYSIGSKWRNYPPANNEPNLQRPLFVRLIACSVRARTLLGQTPTRS